MPAKKKASNAKRPSLAAVTVTTPATPQPPNNPFYLKAVKLATMGDTAGLKALDAELAAAGYAAHGLTRLFIKQALG